jgi:hypothetical protein
MSAATYTGSYPFLHISRTYGLLYEDVLALADYARAIDSDAGPMGGIRVARSRARESACYLALALGPHPALEEIVLAVQRQEAIRRGEVAPW